MKSITAFICIAVLTLLSAGCGPSMKSIIEAKVPELKQMETGRHDLGEFKRGQATPFRMLPAVKDRECTVEFKTVPESRHFDIVIDDGRVFRADNDNDLKKLAQVRLDVQSFYLEFRQDMRMIVEVFIPKQQKMN